MVEVTDSSSVAITIFLREVSKIKTRLRVRNKMDEMRGAQANQFAILSRTLKRIQFALGLIAGSAITIVAMKVNYSSLTQSRPIQTVRVLWNLSALTPQEYSFFDQTKIIVHGAQFLSYLRWTQAKEIKPISLNEAKNLELDPLEMQAYNQQIHLLRMLQAYIEDSLRQLFEVRIAADSFNDIAMDLD